MSYNLQSYSSWPLSSVQSLSCVQLSATPWIAACQASLSISNSWSLPKLMSIELVRPSNHLILCRPLLLPPSIFLSIRVFSNESVLTSDGQSMGRDKKVSRNCSSPGMLFLMGPQVCSPLSQDTWAGWIVANFSRPFSGQSQHVHTLGPFHLSSSASIPSQLQVSLQPCWPSC